MRESGGDEKKTGKDPRVTARFMTPGRYMIIFWSAALACGCNLGLYILFAGAGVVKLTGVRNIINAIVIMLVYLAIMAGIVCFFVYWYRKKILMEPTLKLCQAAQKVASGDFTVRLEKEPRRDGKKDEFDVLYEDFNVMVSELASTEIMKNDFISTVSHEFKTPAAVIQNYVELLQSGNLSEAERRQYLDRVHDAAARLSRMITNILYINRLEHQKIRPTSKPFNLSESIAASILDFDQKLEEKNIDLQVDMDEDLEIPGDEQLLRLVWTNLLSNAVKFTPAGGQITVRMQKCAEGAVVSISDNGCGIDAKSLNHIFDKFYQADTSHSTEGNGLGLALVKKIVDLSGGTIHADSAPGKGMTFTVNLPD